MTISEEKECVTIFVVSGSTGETASKLAATSVTQYSTVGFALTRRAFVKDEDKLVQTLEGAKKTEAMVLHTAINGHLVATANQLFNEHQLFHFDVLTPPAVEVKRLTGVAPMREPGALHHLNKNYFERIRTMELTVKYDSGKDPQGFSEADALLLGISRASETPLSLFLANKDLEVANLPLIPEVHLSKQLSEMDPRKIVSLTSDLSVLNEIRKERMYAYGLPKNTSYSDIEKIRRELTSVNDPYQKLGCIVIDIASLSTEEATSVILSALDLEDHSYYSTETSEG